MTKMAITHQEILNERSSADSCVSQRVNPLALLSILNLLSISISAIIWWALVIFLNKSVEGQWTPSCS